MRGNMRGGEIWPPGKPAARAALLHPSSSDQTLAPEKGRAAASSVAARQIPTPEKPPQRGRRAGATRRSGTAKIEAADVKLPEKYQILLEFFNCMESSIRLLRLKGSTTSFPDVCKSVQHLSGRRFTYSHLAKLKYLLPEAIEIKKILLRDDMTCCMKPDLQVSLLVDAVKSNPKNKGGTGYSVLRGIFWQRLVDFFKDHPEAGDIPEHELPHLFNQTKLINIINVPGIVVKPTVIMPSSVPSEHQPVALSHMPHSFKRRFSRPQESPSAASLINSGSPLEKKENAIPFAHRTSLPDYEASEKSGKPEKDVAFACGIPEGTPVKSCSTPVRLMVSMPELHTPKQPISATTYETSQQKEGKRSARTKLFAAPAKDKISLEEVKKCTIMSTDDDDDDSLSFLPKSLLQSVKRKAEKALEEKEAGFADRSKRQKLMACLPGTFDIIFLIYQSKQHSVMTKQELIHKIVRSNPNIVDRGEVEEQLRLLQELVPDWISEKTARAGDILCCINTSLSQAEIRRKLHVEG